MSHEMPETFMYSQLNRLVGAAHSLSAIYSVKNNSLQACWCHQPWAVMALQLIRLQHGITWKARHLCMMLAPPLETALISSGSDCLTADPIEQHVAHQSNVPGSLPMASNETDSMRPHQHLHK